MMQLDSCAKCHKKQIQIHVQVYVHKPYTLDHNIANRGVTMLTLCSVFPV